MRFLEHVRIPALALLVVASLQSTAAAQSLPAPVLREAYPLSEDAPRPDPEPDPDPDPTPGGTVNFTEDTTTDIRNPERGFYRSGVMDITDSSAPNYTKYYDVDRQTIGYQRVELGNWVNSDHLPATLISTMKKNLAAARGTGIKAVLRFRYSSSKDADATKARQLNHIADLKSLFTDYADVIAYIEAGFIGQFGEWHDSRYIGNDPNDPGDVQDMKDIATALMNSVPPSRMIAFRALSHGRLRVDADEQLAGVQRYRQGPRRGTCGWHRNEQDPRLHDSGRPLCDRDDVLGRPDAVFGPRWRIERGRWHVHGCD